MDIFKIVGKIALDGTDDFNRDIDEAKGKGASLATAIGRGLGTVAKIGGAAITAASAAMVAVGKSSLDAYAEFEQLVGGVDTLFKDSSATLQQYAQQAFMTAGLSANEYMATVTSFSASLLQGLGGDTALATEYADMAIRDMSDNANKMGTDIGMIQNAYQGFAKQNYTMLDNLKLGYGGTRTEMERLLQDANRINKEQGIITNYSIDNLSDVYEAIHVIQEEMGIYGTTLDEASETITGSLNATKAAWKNLLVGFADGNQDLDILIDNFVSSITTAARNIVPRLAQILGGISEAMAEIIPVITEELPGLLAELLPGILKGAGALIQGLVAALPGLLVVLKDALFQILGGIWDYIFLELLGTDYDFSTAFSDLTKAAQKAWSDIQKTWNAIGKPIWDSITRCVDIARGIFAEKMPEISGFASDAFNDISAWWNDSLQPCLQAIGDFIETYLAPVFEKVFATRLKAAVNAGFQFISDMWNNVLMPTLNGITEFLTGVFTGNWARAFEGLKSIFNAWSMQLETIWNAVVTYFVTMLQPLMQAWPALWDSFVAKVAEVATSVSEWWEQIKATIAEKVESALATVTTKFDEIKTTISSRVNDAWSKVEEAFTKIKKSIEEKIHAARDAVKDAIEAIKGFFDFEFKWPHIPLPHFSISPAGWKVGDLLNGITPTLGIEWYAKGGILNDAAIFGMNGNKLMVGGEAGPEAVAPIDTLQQYVAEAVAGQNAAVVNALDRILEAVVSLDENMGGHMRDALDGTALTVNNREFARMVRGAASV